MILVLSLSFLLLFAANSLLSTAGTAFSRAYTQNLTADLSIAPRGQVQFTLFGSDALLIEDFMSPPIFSDPQKLVHILETEPWVESWAGVLSLPVQLQLPGSKGNFITFGVDFPSYQVLFPDLFLVHGTFPGSTSPGIMLQEHQYLAFGSPELATPIILTATDGISFTIREVPLAGVYRYPVQDTLLERVILTDAQTVRGLGGYVYGSAPDQDLPGDQEYLFDSNLDDLFSLGNQEQETFDSEEQVVEEQESSLVNQIENLLASPSEEVVAARTTLEGAWHFFLVRTLNTSYSAANNRLRNVGIENTEGYLVRNWRGTVGGTVLLVWYLQIILNAGIVFIILGAIIITMNALVLSVLERTKEIGTMRALGATRLRVGTMVALETLGVVGGSALAGIVGGVVLVLVFNLQDLQTTNQYLAILFGGTGMRGTLGFGLILGHIAAALVLALASVLYPLHKTLKIHPAKAMA